MLRIAVCDDEESFLDKIQSEILSICKEHKIECDIEIYLSAFEMLSTNAVSNNNIFFIDIEMPNMNGFELSKKLINSNDNIYIIFVTNKDELVFESLKYHPYFFIRKNHMDEELETQILEMNNLINNAKSDLLLVQTNESEIYIEVRNIIYIESNKNYINLHLGDNIVTTRRTMNDIEKELDKYNFIRVHSGFIINPKYIEDFTSNEVILSNKLKIQISRSKKLYVKEKIMEAIIND